MANLIITANDIGKTFSCSSGGGGATASSSSRLLLDYSLYCTYIPFDNIAEQLELKKFKKIKIKQALLTVYNVRGNSTQNMKYGVGTTSIVKKSTDNEPNIYNKNNVLGPLSSETFFQEGSGMINSSNTSIDITETVQKILEDSRFQSGINYIWLCAPEIIQLNGNVGASCSNELGSRATITIEYYTSNVKYYNGRQWVDCQAKYYDGEQWTLCQAKYYDGEQWN